MFRTKRGSYAGITAWLESSPWPRRKTREDELQAQVNRLIRCMRIAVIYGGNKADDGAVINATVNTRSWKSYKSVAEDIAGSIERLGCPNVNLMPGDMRLGDALQKNRVDLAWLNTGGVQGFSPVSQVPAMLEMFGVPYVGHKPLAATILDNKHSFKRELLALGIPTAPFIVWQSGRETFDPHKGPRHIEFFERNDGPFVVKPVSGRASLHVHFVERVEDISIAVSEINKATENQSYYDVGHSFPGPGFDLPKE